ncbi:hypothetical protein [Streptomyces sp. fd1-xmd]|uniref:hypothetical protein n=1 Tax=Streptomyces sp. fd1-xmd TaxID=1812480 RepID=UPI0013520D15|nr:hypothetical protein [Streptomyces sp. fd1-xmd]
MHPDPRSALMHPLTATRPVDVPPPQAIAAASAVARTAGAVSAAAARSARCA